MLTMPTEFQTMRFCILSPSFWRQAPGQLLRSARLEPRLGDLFKDKRLARAARRAGSLRRQASTPRLPFTSSPRFPLTPSCHCGIFAALSGNAAQGVSGAGPDLFPLLPTNDRRRRARMSTDAPRPAARSRVSRRDFLKRTGWGTVGMTPLIAGATRRRASAQPASPYPDWMPPSPKPPKRGKLITRASAWDPPVLDPRLTNSVGLSQFATLTSNRLVRYPFSDEASSTTDLTLKGDLAESWQGSPDFRIWTFKLRKGVKWQNVPPLNGRELVAADIKYCYEAYAKEGVQSFTFQEIEGMEIPDKYTLRMHLKSPNTMFPQNLAEPVSVVFSREVLEEDGDLKKRLIGTGPYILKEHTRKVRAVLARNPDYFDQGRPYIDEYHILSTPDAATRLAAFRSGQSDIHFVASLADAAAVLKTTPGAVVQ